MKSQTSYKADYRQNSDWLSTPSPLRTIDIGEIRSVVTETPQPLFSQLYATELTLALMLSNEPK
jgi:hypothetical protein